MINVFVQLLKKSGWKEGAGLGATEQGRLDPVESYLKQDRRGIGAGLKKKNKVILSSEERRNQRKALKVSIFSRSNPSSHSLDCTIDDIANFITLLVDSVNDIWWWDEPNTLILRGEYCLFLY